jgi:hypothetical protein
MSIAILIPIFVGITFSIAINYFADLLPFTFNLTRPSCHTEGCNTQYTWIDYLFLRRCDGCGTRSRLRHVITSGLTIAVSIYLWVNQSSEQIFILSILVVSYLFVVGLIDLEHHLILLPLNITGLFILGGTGVFLHGWMSTLLGGFAGAGILYLLFLLGKVFTRIRARKLNVSPKSLEDSLAFGDVLLVSLLGLFLGWPIIWFGVLLGLLLAGLLSILVILILALRNKYKQRALSVFIPLGPGFIIAAITIIYFPNFISSFWL